MGYALKWGDKTWLYGLALGLGFGMAILLLFWEMFGEKVFWNYYSPMLGYYVLISICQSHYFKRKPEPDMGGMFRQFVSIFGAILIFFFNQMIMLHIFAVPQTPHDYLEFGGIMMTGHFTFIVFGFFIYGFDDFMFKGKLLGWIKSDLVKAVVWYFFIWFMWAMIFYWLVGEGHSIGSFDVGNMDRFLAISQWTIIMSLLYALVFKDWIPDLQRKMAVKNDFLFGLFLLLAAIGIAAAISYLLYGIIPFIAPWEESLNFEEKWHHILYMGTYPLTPAILLGTYTTNFSGTSDTGKRVIKRLFVLVPSIIILYFAFHLLIAEPHLWINALVPGTVSENMGLFRTDGGWFHQLDLYFNFTVSIIPLTHHWFCAKAGFVKKVD